MIFSSKVLFFFFFPCPPSSFPSGRKSIRSSIGSVRDEWK